MAGGTAWGQVSEFESGWCGFLVYRIEWGCWKNCLSPITQHQEMSRWVATSGVLLLAGLLVGQWSWVRSLLLPQALL